MVDVDMNMMPPRIIGREACYRLEVFQGSPRTQKACKHLKEGGVKGNKGIYEGEKRRCAT